MGDPECQVIIPRLKTDIVKVFRNTVSNKLKNTNISLQKQKCMTIVLCSKGYPGNYEKNKVIKNLKSLNSTIMILFITQELKLIMELHFQMGVEY